MNVEVHKPRILSVVNIFETGTPEGNYADISIFADGKGGTRQITYGRSQTTEQGYLKDLVAAYIANNGTFSDQFKAYLPKIGVTPLVDNAEFKALLKRAAQDDDIMLQTQDDFFDKKYFQPAFKWFTANGFTLPLSMLVIYDSFIHSGSIPDWLRKKFPESPPVRGGDEKAWIKAYVNVRHDWLLSKGEPLSKTIYRTNAFKTAMANGDWELPNPLVTQGKKSRSIGPSPIGEPTELIEITPLRGYNRFGLRRKR